MSGKRSTFTCARDAKILELVDQGKNWETIGRLMGTDPETCKSRYEDYLAPGGKKNIWATTLLTVCSRISCFNFF